MPQAIVHPQITSATLGLSEQIVSRNSSLKTETFVPVHQPGARINARGFAAKHSFSNPKLVAFKRSAAQGTEIESEVLYCGVRHSDIHQVKNEWKNTVYPCMPGHEIVGRVDTQEVLDFCAKHGTGRDIQVIPADELNDAYDRVEKGEVRFRYVIDMASLKTADRP